MKQLDSKAFFISVACDLLLCAALLTCLACAGGYPLKNKGAASVLFYNEPMNESEVSDADRLSPLPSDSYTGGIVQYSQALKLRRYVNSVRSWTDDNNCDRELFTFAGQFQVLNNDFVYYFTEDGMIYYNHYFGRLSDEGTEFLMSLRP